MIISQLNGGLGNQMFQYAAGRRLAYTLSADFKIDITGLESNKLRGYALDCFNTQLTFTTPSDLKLVNKGNASRLARIKKIICGDWHRSRITCYKERHFHFDPIVLSLSDNSYLDGYWQSEKYFLDVADIIKNDFTFTSTPSETNQSMAEKILNHNAVAIHIRRGDYIADPNANKIHNTYNIEYYRKAISNILGKVNDPHFYIFSDEPDWVKNNFIIDSPTTYVSHNNESTCYEDMRLISLCKHQIIANSSFSWWGAWLNSNPDKIVIAPQRWFNVTETDTSDLIPNSWLKI